MCRVPFCFVFGCRTVTRHSDHRPPLDRVYCSYCGSTTWGEYVRDDTWFSLCFIPLVPLCYGSPYLKCDVCNFRLSNIYNDRKCSKCNKNVPTAYSFCPDCGTHTQSPAQSPT